MITEMRVCECCHIKMPLSSFPPCEKKRDGTGIYHKRKCRQCHRAAKKRYKETRLGVKELRALPPEGFNPVMQQFLRAKAC